MHANDDPQACRMPHLDKTHERTRQLVVLQLNIREFIQRCEFKWNPSYDARTTTTESTDVTQRNSRTICV